MDKYNLKSFIEMCKNYDFDVIEQISDNPNNLSETQLMVNHNLSLNDMQTIKNFKTEFGEDTTDNLGYIYANYYISTGGALPLLAATKLLKKGKKIKKLGATKKGLKKAVSRGKKSKLNKKKLSSFGKSKKLSSSSSGKKLGKKKLSSSSSGKKLGKISKKNIVDKISEKTSNLSKKINFLDGKTDLSKIVEANISNLKDDFEKNINKLQDNFENTISSIKEESSEEIKNNINDLSNKFDSKINELKSEISDITNKIKTQNNNISEEDNINTDTENA